MSYLRDVETFQRDVTGIEPASAPTLVGQEYIVARANFMNEELDEFIEASMNGNIVGAADALVDLVYVALGTALSMGIPFDECWAAVQRANMRKVPGMTKRGIANDAMKPPGWYGPESDIAQAITNATPKS